MKKFIENLFRKEEKEIESLNYIFCTDDRILAINKEYLQHDYFTDIISFELSHRKAPVLGEIYISVDRVKDNAKTLKESFSQELLRVIFHGALHLCGYKDKTQSHIRQMRQREDHYLAQYNKIRST